MTQSSNIKADTLKKWESIIDNKTESKSDFSSTIFPSIRKIAAQTIGFDLVEVKPLSSPMGGNSSEEIKEIRKDIKAENRNRKIESITNDSEYEEMGIEDHPKYKSGLFYLDYEYDSKKSKIKKKKNG